MGVAKCLNCLCSHLKFQIGLLLSVIRQCMELLKFITLTWEDASLSFSLGPRHPAEEMDERKSTGVICSRNTNTKMITEI